jgi:hypothetical protein
VSLGEHQPDEAYHRQHSGGAQRHPGELRT